MSRSIASASARVRGAVDQDPAPGLAGAAAEQQVLGDRELPDEGELLGDHGDAEPARRLGRPGRQRHAVDLDVAAVAVHGTGQRAHQGGLAGAVLPDDADDLAGVQVELGQVEDADRAVGLVDAPQPRGDRAAGGVW